LKSLNLGKVFDAEPSPDKVAIIDLAGGVPAEITYRAFDDLCDGVARGLLRRGLKAGDRVGILALNSIKFLAAFFGTMRAGMVTVPVSIKLPRETIEYIIGDAGLAAVFHDAGRAALCPAGMTRIGFDDGGFEDFLDPGPFTTIEPRGREVGIMLYTSGSTGRPKGVLLSHASQLWGLETARSFYTEDLSRHRSIVAAPMFHMNATISVKSALMNGGSIVLLPAFDARRYAEAIDRHAVTWLTSVPTMLALVAREKELCARLDFSKVRRVTMGSAPLTQALVDKVQALFPNAIVNNSYGTTEAGPVVFGPHPHGRPRPPTSAGYPAPGSEMELREGPNPDEGVLYMRNPSHMEGYHNLPQKTAEVMHDGWYRSGDIFRRDADGFFHFLGRADDMFVVGGENVWPGEIEKLIERLDGVHQCLVVPVADEIKGALPFAFVVPKPGAALDEDAVKRHALANGPAFAHPRYVTFVPEIPLAATNKPDRKMLTERAAQLAKTRPRATVS
jgi:acyl-CoA synthetase (AMP-forming)/AMP-acid ligase II